jgi:hypothetical protein
VVRTILVALTALAATATVLGQDPWTAAIAQPSRFGGPNSVGDTIADDREGGDPTFRLPDLDEARSNWFQWKDRVLPR